MSNVIRIAAVALVMGLAGLSSQASARGLYPLTECGPDLGRLCRLHGKFEAPPFHYNLAIHPGCLRRIAVATPHGVQYRRVLVCGTADRQMVWW
jgi:hypothetical protein